jgi:hypothetical protein
MFVLLGKQPVEIFKKGHESAFDPADVDLLIKINDNLIFLLIFYDEPSKSYSLQIT